MICRAVFCFGFFPVTASGDRLVEGCVAPPDRGRVFFWMCDRISCAFSTRNRPALIS